MKLSDAITAATCAAILAAIYEDDLRRVWRRIEPRIPRPRSLGPSPVIDRAFANEDTPRGTLARGMAASPEGGSHDGGN